LLVIELSHATAFLLTQLGAILRDRNLIAILNSPLIQVHTTILPRNPDDSIP
jgi:hypothetical protein